MRLVLLWAVAIFAVSIGVIAILTAAFDARAAAKLLGMAFVASVVALMLYTPPR